MFKLFNKRSIPIAQLNEAEYRHHLLNEASRAVASFPDDMPLYEKLRKFRLYISRASKSIAIDSLLLECLMELEEYDRIKRDES